MALQFTERKKCPACHTSEATSLYAVPYNGSEMQQYLKAFYGPQGGVDLAAVENATFEIMECSTCQLLYQQQIPGDDMMEVLYEQWIDPQKVRALELEGYDQAYHFKDANEIMALVAYFKQMPADLSFFDFGMGWGKWCQMAMGFGVQAAGAELSPTRIKHAQSLGIRIVHWDEIPTEAFDFISTEQVMEHLPHPLDTLMHLRKGLKPGGILKFSVPNGGDIKARMKKMDWMAGKDSPDSLNAIAPLEHINCFRYETIVHMARQAGLEEIKLPWSGPFPPASGASTGAGLKWWTGSSKAMLKNIARPVYHQLFAANKSYAKGTRLYFRAPLSK